MTLFKLKLNKNCDSIFIKIVFLGKIVVLVIVIKVWNLKDCFKK